MQSGLDDVKRMGDECRDDACSETGSALYEGRREDSLLALDGRVDSRHGTMGNPDNVVLMLDLGLDLKLGLKLGLNVGVGVSRAMQV